MPYYWTIWVVLPGRSFQRPSGHPPGCVHKCTALSPTYPPSRRQDHTSAHSVPLHTHQLQNRELGFEPWLKAAHLWGAQTWLGRKAAACRHVCQWACAHSSFSVCVQRLTPTSLGLHAHPHALNKQTYGRDTNAIPLNAMPLHSRQPKHLNRQTLGLWMLPLVYG